MDPPSNIPSCELFLVLEGFTSRMEFFFSALLPITEAAEEGPLLLSVDALYQTDKDIALLAMRFDARTLTPGKSEWLVNLATKAGIPVLEPMRLTELDRRLFYERYLRSYTVRIDQAESPEASLDSLGKLLGLLDVNERTDVRRMQRLREKLNEKSSARRVSRSAELPPPPPPTNSPSGTIDLELEPQASQPRTPKRRDPVARLSSPPPTPPPVPRASGKRGARLGKGTDCMEAISLETPSGQSTRRNNRAHTIPARPPRSLAPTEPSSSSSLQVRLQRGDSWTQARLRNLTTKEARLATSSAPPLGSAIRLAISIGEIAVTVSGVVVEVVSTERSVDGSTSIRIEFRDVCSRDRQSLIVLLRAAHEAGLSLTAPPPRKNARFSISWPVAVSVDGTRFNAAALDISERGLFLATTNLIRANRIVFGLPLEHEETAIQGRARIAREVTAVMARSRGLQRGYGLQIEGLTPATKKYFADFLIRVRRRSQRHVIIAGSGERLQLLGQSLHNAGYTVSKATNVEMMMRRTQFEACPPDAAILDDSIQDSEIRESFESAFRVHGIPTFESEGQAPHIARHAVDHMLSVSR